MKSIFIFISILLNLNISAANTETKPCITILERLALVNSLAKTLYNEKMVEGFIDLTLQKNRPFPRYTIVATSVATHRKLLATYVDYLKKSDENVLYYGVQQWSVQVPDVFLKIEELKKVLEAKDKDTLYFSIKERLQDLLVAIAKFRIEENSRSKRIVLVLSDINLTVNEAGQPSGVYDRWTAINDFAEKARQFNVEVVIGAEKMSSLPTSHIYDIGGIRIIHF